MRKRVHIIIISYTNEIYFTGRGKKNQAATGFERDEEQNHEPIWPRQRLPRADWRLRPWIRSLSVKSWVSLNYY